MTLGLLEVEESTWVLGSPTDVGFVDLLSNLSESGAVISLLSSRLINSDDTYSK